MINKIKTFGLIATAFTLFSCTGEKEVANYNIIPAIETISQTNGAPFILTPDTKIVYEGNDQKMQRNAEFLAEYLMQASGNKYDIVNTSGAKGIVLKIEEGNENPESYKMVVDSDGVTISAPTSAGVFYGIQTFRKSLPASYMANVELPSVTIEDEPRFGYRGVHFDVARHFYSVEEVKKFIDMMALHNMNRLHWHLTEDQGWRIEIKKYPLLSTISSKRKETVIGRNSGKYDGKPYGGIYTQEEAKEVVAYAAERNIIVIPEIDLPGHMQAALAAYPDYGCTGGPYEVWTQWGVSDNVICAGNEEAMKFLENVLDEIIEIFPSQYIHIGGDECPKAKWAECPKCQTKIKELKIKGDDKHSKEEYLQSYVIKRVEKYLNGKGRYIIGWDEILEGGLSETATVMAWRGEGHGLEAAKMGNNVIMSPNSYLYFDYYQSSDTENEPLAIGGYLPLERVYSYEPMHPSLNAEEQKRIIGVQANHWSEYFPTYSQVEYMSLPRWAALAEVQWSGADKKNYEDFLLRLPSLINFYEKAGYNYAKHVFDVEADIVADADRGAVVINLKTLDGAPIYYTLDGSEPTEKSTIYSGELLIKENCIFKAVAIRSGIKSRIFDEQITFSRSTTKKIKESQPVNKQYSYKGITTLVDGLKGGPNYKTGRWIAFKGNDLDVVIDLGATQEVSSVSLSTFVEKGDWIFGARSFIVEISEDGDNYKRVASEEYPVMKQEDRNGIFDHKLTFDKVNARYVKVYVGTERSMPEWHGGKGIPAFMFVDEIVVE